MNNFIDLLNFCQEYGKTKNLYELHSLRYNEKFSEYVVKAKISTTSLGIITKTEHTIISNSLNIACSKAKDILETQLRVGGDAFIEIYGVVENKLYGDTSDVYDINTIYDKVHLVNIEYFDI